MNPVLKVLRQLVPLLAVPLCLIASVLAAAPWLRSFPATVAGGPLYGAALLSVLVPLVTARIGGARLWLGILIDAVVFVIYTLGVVLESPLGFGQLWRGLYHGPSQVLTFALPLISPRSLMVAPALIVWAAGAVAGQCLARRWYTLLPYIGFLIAFGLAYAGTQRAAGSELASARYRETVLAALLLLTLLLMRVAQAWVRQDETAESTQPDGILPLRGLVIGTATTLVVTFVVALAVQTSAFPKKSTAPQRVPSVNESRTLTPMSFIARMRPQGPKSKAQPVFTVSLDQAAPGYFPIANVDYYNGAGWSFDRIFRPSGGVLPDDADALLRHGTTVTQQYRIANGPLTAGPWMPALYRPQKVTGAAINIDPASGMVVPVSSLHSGQSYMVRSTVQTQTLPEVNAATSAADTGESSDLQLPPAIGLNLRNLVPTLRAETGTSSAPPLAFLQALQRDFQRNYTLSAAARGVADSTLSPSPSPTPQTSSPLAPRSSPNAPKSTPARRSPAPHKSKQSSTAKSSHKSKHHPAAAIVRPLAKPKPSGDKHSSPAKHSQSSGRQTQPSGKHSSSPARHPSTSPSAPASSVPTSTSPSTANPSGAADDAAGSAGYSDVLASILGSRQGTPEQFATLMALVARYSGIPARVVTGFRVRSHGSLLLRPGQYDVTTADAWSWVEVPIAGRGWVVLDGTPGTFATSNAKSESAAPAPSTSSVPQSQEALVTQGNGNAVAKHSKVQKPASRSHTGLLVALVLVAIVLLLAVLIVLLSRKPRRAARRRKAPDPRARVIGAWRESIDMLTEAGLPEMGTMTSAEIAELASERFGPPSGDRTASLGSTADAVTYSSATVVGSADADRAWNEHRLLRREVLGTMPLRDRVSARVRYYRPRRLPDPVSPPSWAAQAAERAAAGRHSAGGRSSRRRSPAQRGNSGRHRHPRRH